jgi:energy-coupling factor transporter ATP-binding protein EcfA2
MLHKLSINNYKIFDEFEVSFKPGENLICGKTGSGKSVLVEVLQNVTNFIKFPNSEVGDINKCFSVDSIRSWSILSSEMKKYVNISLEVKNKKKEIFIYDLIIGYDDKECNLYVYEESLKYKLKEEDSLKERLLLHRIDNNTISTIRFESFNNKKIRKFYKLIKKFRSINLNIDPFLINEVYNRSTNKSLIKEECEYFIPNFIKIAEDGEEIYIIRNINGYEFQINFNDFGSGQKILLKYYTLLNDLPDNSVVIMDDLGNHVPPNEIQPLLNKIHDTWEEKNVQFIMMSSNYRTLNFYNQNALVFNVEQDPPKTICYTRNEDRESEIKCCTPEIWNEVF